MNTHKNLEAWRASAQVAEQSFLLARDCWAPWASALFGQLQRAALSVQLNIAEGWSFGPTPTCTRHLGIAYGSAVEAGELLQLVVRLHLAAPARLEPIMACNGRSQRLLLGLLKTRRPL